MKCMCIIILILNEEMILYLYFLINILAYHIVNYTKSSLEIY